MAGWAQLGFRSLRAFEHHRQSTVARTAAGRGDGLLLTVRSWALLGRGAHSRRRRPEHFPAGLKSPLQLLHTQSKEDLLCMPAGCTSTKTRPAQKWAFCMVRARPGSDRSDRAGLPAAAPDATIWHHTVPAGGRTLRRALLRRHM